MAQTDQRLSGGQKGPAFWTTRGFDPHQGPGSPSQEHRLDLREEADPEEELGCWPSAHLPAGRGPPRKARGHTFSRSRLGLRDEACQRGFTRVQNM